MQVTYRGIKYDTNDRKKQPRVIKVVSETYRGIKFNKEVEVAK